MKCVVMVALLAIGASGRMTAQSPSFKTITVLSVLPVQSDSGFCAGCDRQLMRPARLSVNVGVGVGDSLRAPHHYVRNGAIAGGSMGFIAGAIGGSLLTCVNCSKGTITGEILAVGAAGGLVGAILGGIAGQVVGWTHH